MDSVRAQQIIEKASSCLRESRKYRSNPLSTKLVGSKKSVYDMPYECEDPSSPFNSKMNQDIFKILKNNHDPKYSANHYHHSSSTSSSPDLFFDEEEEEEEKLLPFEKTIESRRKLSSYPYHHTSLKNSYYNKDPLYDSLKLYEKSGRNSTSSSGDGLSDTGKLEIQMIRDAQLSRRIKKQNYYDLHDCSSFYHHNTPSTSSRLEPRPKTSLNLISLSSGGSSSSRGSSIKECDIYNNNRYQSNFDSLSTSELSQFGREYAREKEQGKRRNTNQNRCRTSTGDYASSSSFSITNKSTMSKESNLSRQFLGHLTDYPDRAETNSQVVSNLRPSSYSSSLSGPHHHQQNVQGYVRHSTAGHGQQERRYQDISPPIMSFKKKIVRAGGGETEDYFMRGGGR